MAHIWKGNRITYLKKNHRLQTQNAFARAIGWVESIFFSKRLRAEKLLNEILRKVAFKKLKSVNIFCSHIAFEVLENLQKLLFEKKSKKKNR
jgi:hypothetical protein